MNLLPSILLLVLGFASSPGAYAAQPFPSSPDARLTPGSLCVKPDAKRYPEGIAYCERKVHPELKARVMQIYDQRLGYRVTAMKRQLFKIDHYIPLCMGGSNEPENLWPQHESVYVLTDPLEELTCTKMSEGRLSQKDAVTIIKQAKANPARAAEIIGRVELL